MQSELDKINDLIKKGSFQTREEASKNDKIVEN